MPRLCGRCRSVTVMRRGLFRRSRAGGNSTPAAVIADMVYGSRVDYGLTVNIVNVRNVHVIHRGVVVESSVVPISPSVADATIAVAVVDAAVEADRGTPIAFIPSKGIVAPTPVTGRPEQTSLGRLSPRARHPEIAFFAVSPVTGRPQITALRTKRLRVLHQFGRSDRDGQAELRQRDGRHGHYGQYQKTQRQKTDCAHLEPPCQIILRL